MGTKDCTCSYDKLKRAFPKGGPKSLVHSLNCPRRKDENKTRQSGHDIQSIHTIKR